MPDISGIPKANRWTKEELERAVANLPPPGEKGTSEFGVTDSCPFNELSSFHAIGQLPFDPMHDFFERVGSCDGQSIVLTLIAEKKFTLLQYNAVMAKLPLKFYETSDRPLPVKAQSDKLQGTALAVGMQIRLMTFLIHQLVDDDEVSPALELLFLLHQLQEYIMADAYNPADRMAFEELMVLYLAKRRECFELFPFFTKIVSKYHFMEHYEEQMEGYGPLTGVWTARFESKHRDYINWTESCKNWINLLKTLAEKNQKKMATR